MTVPKGSRAAPGRKTPMRFGGTRMLVAGGVRRRRFYRVFAILAVLAIIAGIAVFAVTEAWFGATDPGPPAAIVIEPGTPLSAIARRLEDEGLIPSARVFMGLAKARGLAAKVRAGEFAVPRGVRPDEVLNALVFGPEIQHRLVVPEGTAMRRIAAMIVESGIDTRPVVETLISSAEFARSLGVPAARLEGYLFPDTYHYVRGEGAKTILTRMVERFFEVYDDPMRARQNARGRTMHEIVTLASIVEKETGVPHERALIAGVFSNRLARGMRLQSDPTVIYALGEKYAGDLNRRNMLVDSPYNTYVRAGLPPGPIASPGRDALLAALWPADTNAVYFVSRNDGTHVFNADYREHVNAVNRYQRGR
ncbi:endolytic transglycosylase MltG [bacterium]|nr:endolytic transglycosylase MltG [bacterium]